MNIKEICDYIHNYFELETIDGSFTITDGSLDVDILNNQYYRIQGSIFNDGIYKHGNEELTDETFKGRVSLMAIPKDVLDVLNEATEWQQQNAKVLNSPYQSESFGGYSYSKGTSGKKDGSQGAYTWRDVFGDRLKAYRKIG